MSGIEGRVRQRLQPGGAQNVTPRVQPIMLGIRFTRKRTKTHALTHTAALNRSNLRASSTSAANLKFLSVLEASSS